MSNKEGVVLTFSDLVQLIRKEYDREEMGYARAAQIVDRAIEGHIREAALRARIDELQRLNFQEASGFISGGKHIVRQQVVAKRIAELAAAEQKRGEDADRS